MIKKLAKTNKIPEPIKYYYIRDWQNNPIGCIAYRIPKDKKTGIFAYSICNPKDKFDKKLAKLIATSRMENSPHKFSRDGKWDTLWKGILVGIFHTMFKFKIPNGRFKESINFLIKYDFPTNY